MPALRLAACLAAVCIASQALALDKMKVAVGQRGGWPTSIPEIAQKYGYFARHGLDVEVLYTNGGGETMQPVLAQAIDVGVAVGTSAAMGVFQKGAPVRIIGNQTTGASDIVWYVAANSPIKKYEDFDGRSLSYSTNGSSSHVFSQALAEHFKIKPRLVPTGDMAGTLTQVLSGQVDVGWLAPPVGLEPAQSGRTRIIGSAGVIPKYKDQTVRVMVARWSACGSAIPGPAAVPRSLGCRPRKPPLGRTSLSWSMRRRPGRWNARSAPGTRCPTPVLRGWKTRSIITTMPAWGGSRPKSAP